MRALGIDLGDSRTGYAVSDELGFGVSTLPQLNEKGLHKIAEHSVRVAEEYNVSQIVLGYPKNMNGSVGPRGEKTEIFKKLLEELTDIPVLLWDERLTTVSAHNLMNVTTVRGKKRKNSVDSVSAAYILQSYLDSKR